MTNNVAQYATILDAFGCILELNSVTGELHVVDSPKGKKTIVNEALEDIKYFDDTTNFTDGAAAFCTADLIDGEANPLADEVKINILTALGLLENGKYIYQALGLQKNNRSWHRSPTPNVCDYFEELCTHRGVNSDSSKKGRKSNRRPEEFHPISSTGIIAREQLVTPNVQKLYENIPSDAMTSGQPQRAISMAVLKKFRNLDAEQRAKLLTDLAKEEIAV